MWLVVVVAIVVLVVVFRLFFFCTTTNEIILFLDIFFSVNTRDENFGILLLSPQQYTLWQRQKKCALLQYTYQMCG